jgi:hypothetical protein
VTALIFSVTLALPQTAHAQTCGRAVILTLPGVTWEQVNELKPPNLLAAVDGGAVGSMSVRTNSSRTTHASGFATIGAGTRIDVPTGAGQPFGAQSRGWGSLTVPDVEDIDELAEEQGYSLATPGALGRAVAASGETRVGGVTAIGNSDLGLPPPTPAGLARPSTLAAMDDDGRVARAATGADLLQASAAAPFGVRTDPVRLAEDIDEALADPCAVAVVDPGDLIRADTIASIGEEVGAREDALEAADVALGQILDRLDPASDLLLIVSPSSPLSDERVHFGVAVAAGPGFEPGSLLSSASTRRPGMVTLPDVAPTVLGHLDIERPSAMLGRPWFAGESASDRVAAAVDLDREAVFIDAVRTPISTAFVVFQLVVYAGAVWVLARRRGDDESGSRMLRVLQDAALFLAAFPMATYLAGLVQGHELGEWAYGGLLLAITAAIVATALVVVRSPLDRLLIVVGTTFALLIVDLVVGAPLQLNTVFSYSPIVAGRFAGIGNIGFAILAATSVLTGALIVHRWGARRWSLIAVAALFALTVIVDGAPQYGSDVGGAIALVPGLAIAWLLIAGRRPNLKAVAFAGLAGALVLGLFLAADLARPEESRTHLARLYEDVRTGGGQVFVDAIVRKVRTNLRVLGSTIWTFVVPPALGLLAWLLLRPRWSWLSETYPKVHAGLVAGLIMSVLGYAVNDSGIVIPAMMFSYLVPVAVAPVSEAALYTETRSDEL